MTEDLPDDEILKVMDVSRVFATRRRLFGKKGRSLRALDRVSLTVKRGENFGIVGESGSGKSTLAKLIMGLDAPTSGSLFFEGKDIAALSREERKAFRIATHIVFQDPNSSLSPRMRVKDIIAEPIVGLRDTSEVQKRVADVIALVGLPVGSEERFPHQFSGGQRQRVAIARAVANNPMLLILDEPVSALDVSIRSQVLNLLAELKERLNLTYVTIAHDLAVVYQACDTTAVLYLGSVMELGPSEQLFKDPLHPYTQLLVSSIPVPDPQRRMVRREEGTSEIPSPYNVPPGCRFHTRCPLATEYCRAAEPEYREVRPGRFVACHEVPVEANLAAMGVRS